MTKHEGKQLGDSFIPSDLNEGDEMMFLANLGEVVHQPGSGNSHYPIIDQVLNIFGPAVSMSSLHDAPDFNLAYAA